MKRLIRWLSRYYIEICEGCEGLYWASSGNETGDMVTLCPGCWLECINDPDCILADDELETA
jgi:hypothetical protein